MSYPGHRYIFGITAVVALIMAMASCRKNQENLYPWGWESAGGATDSLMVPLQEAFLGDTPLDSCLLLLNRFHELASRPGAQPIEQARAIFWDARLAFAMENYGESHRLFREALVATDSARYPYDAKYIHLCLEPLEGRVLDAANPDWEWYVAMIDDLDYALSHDAPVLGGIRAQYLSCTMTYSGNPTRALGYALMADSLFADAGRTADRLANRLNVATNRVLTGDTVGALRDYSWIQQELERGTRSASPLLEPFVCFNCWVQANDTTALWRLREQTAGNPALTGYDALASAYIAGIEMERGMTDSLHARIAAMEAGLDYTDDAAQKAFVLKMLGKSCETLGDAPAALRHLNACADVAEENIRMLSGDRYSVAESTRIIREIDRRRAEEQRTAQIRQWIWLACLILICVALGWLAYNRIDRLKRSGESKNRELEASRRAELSMSINMRERESQIDVLRQKICRLADEGMIEERAAREIKSSIRSEQCASKADDEFGKIFASLSPCFQSRLRELYPRVGRTTLRMAQYIAIGMDNRHIARVMNIRPESVKQNRWRLRQALGLETDDNLDEFLRRMV